MTDRRQRQKEQRAAKREAERKQEGRRELVRRLGTAVVFGVVVVAIVVVSGLEDDQATLPGSYEGFRAQPTACDAEQPPTEEVMSFEAPETQSDITADSEVTATLVTSCGDIVIQLDPAGFPATVNSFVFLAREGFYDGQVFHRISANFQAESGDPNADGTGGPGYIVPDEHPDADFEFEVGVVAMSNRGARSTGSRFFIVIGDDGLFLTPSFNVLGRVVSGQDAIDRITAIPTAASPGSVEESLPLETVYIESVTIEVSGS